jgi:hypothetical protein
VAPFSKFVRNFRLLLNEQFCRALGSNSNVPAERRIGQMRSIELFIDHDAASAEVTEYTVRALRQAALHIGKADRGCTVAQIAEIEDAWSGPGGLQNALRLKKR